MAEEASIRTVDNATLTNCFQQYLFYPASRDLSYRREERDSMKDMRDLCSHGISFSL